MPKKSNAPDGAARPSIPWRIRVRKDEEFRPLSVSMEGTFLGGMSIGGRAEEDSEW